MEDKEKEETTTGSEKELNPALGVRGEFAA